MQEQITRMSQLLFFDDRALQYMVGAAPNNLLIASFSQIDDRLFGAFLRNMTDTQRWQILHGIPAAQSANPSTQHDNRETLGEKNQSTLLPKTTKQRESTKKIQDAFLILANDLLEREVIKKKGCHFYGRFRF